MKRANKRSISRAPAGALARALAAMAALGAMAAMATVAACGSEELPPPDPGDMTDPDPLDTSAAPAPATGSLDELHARILEKRCSGQPGLCHNGQFEPNLSTPGLTYAYLVNRPAIEKPGLLRVAPRSAAQSLFIDKIRNRNGVATQMPLGAPPLEEADIVALEQWIDNGALRAPGAAPAPTLNNPPRRPQIGIFNGTTRLDGAGPINVAVGTTLTLRHTVQDFETADDAIPFAAVVLSSASGGDVVVTTGNDPHVGPTMYDAAGPMGQGDRLNYRRTWTIPAMLELYDKPTNMRRTVAAAGQSIGVAVVYIDSLNQGIVALDVSPSRIQIQ
ncbi:MAG TPA: hypothetical protein VNO30_06875 [Kofleriaceae bacterium]|nr:hypothetical protein [Kofleriaceae bacterium]